ncbi:MAG: GNAT family N-acetyltransferase [Myxococcales bacterium]|nr:GNAT family N-acetyltransferase [Myxococcales bacterium]
MTSFRSASDLTGTQLAEIFTRGFEGYFVPVQVSPRDWSTIVRSVGVDLDSSVVAQVDGHDVGVMAISVRGRTARVAAMGIAAAFRGRGVGRALLRYGLAALDERGFERVLLEVIDGNEGAIRLYASEGFEIARRLVGWERAVGGTTPRAIELLEVDPVQVARFAAAHGHADPPWQLAPETLAAVTPPATGLALPSGDAMALVVDRPDGTTRLLGLAARSDEAASTLLSGAVARKPDRRLSHPPICPEDHLASAFGSAGFTCTDLAQWEMCRRQ